MEFDFFGDEAELEKTANSIQPCSIVTQNRRKMSFVARTEAISEVLADIQDNETQHIISNGSFGSNELLSAFSHKHRIKSIYITTWSFNDEFIETLSNINPDKIVFLCDKSIITRKAAFYGRLLLFAESHKNITIKLINGLHAKVTLLDCNDGFYVYEASANFSRNVRIEQFLISKSKELYDFHLEWITRLL